MAPIYFERNSVSCLPDELGICPLLLGCQILLHGGILQLHLLAEQSFLFVPVVSLHPHGIWIPSAERNTQMAADKGQSDGQPMMLCCALH